MPSVSVPVEFTLALKSRIKSYPKHAGAEKIKDSVQLWMLIEEVCTSTSSINSVAQQALKACLSLNNIYGENMELAKYYEVFLAQARVALEVGIDLGDNSLVILSHVKDTEKDLNLTPTPVWRDHMVKIEPGLKEAEYMKSVN